MPMATHLLAPAEGLWALLGAFGRNRLLYRNIHQKVKIYKMTKIAVTPSIWIEILCIL